MNDHEYLESVGLIVILNNFMEMGDSNQKIMYDVRDLAYIHKIIRQRKPFTTLEFGVGFSTIVISHALSMNEIEFDNLADKPKIRNTKTFKHYVVDTNEFWLKNTQNYFPANLVKYVDFTLSDARIHCLSDLQLCSLYDKIPDVVPEFIYLDGPDPADVKGNVNGLSFNCKERTIVSGDLLLLESTLLPKAFILIDGRTNNARFLKRNLKRQYIINWYKDRDITTLELDEEFLGKYSYYGADLYK